MADGDLTDREREIVESVAARKGRDWADEHQEMILAQARAKGVL